MSDHYYSKRYQKRRMNGGASKQSCGGGHTVLPAIQAFSPSRELITVAVC